MSDGIQPETKTIEAVILSAEARRFWEQAVLAILQVPLENEDEAEVLVRIAIAQADYVLTAWRERFEPKAGE